jgi:hypothetical protein
MRLSRRNVLQVYTDSCDKCASTDGANSTLPVALELGVECTYPIAEGTSAGFLWTAGNVWGVILVTVMDALRTDDGDMSHSMYFMCALGAVAWVMCMTMQTPYLRYVAVTRV